MTTLDDVLDLIGKIKKDIEYYFNQPVSGKHIKVIGGLSEIDKNLGLMTAGEFRTGNGIEPGKGFSGVRMVFPAVSYGGQLYNLVGINNDSLEFGLDASSGKAYFGGGIAVIDQYGLHLYDATGKPVLIGLSADEAINSEALGAGDVLIGDNSSGKPNLLWDNSTGKFHARTGLVTGAEISGGTFKTYGVRVLSDSTGNTIPNDTATSITFNHSLSPFYDDANFFSAGSPDQLTIPTGLGGIYLIGAGVQWASNGTGIRDFHLMINGAEGYSPTDLRTGISTDDLSMSAVHERDLAEGDVIKLRVRQTTGGNFDAQFGYIWMRKTS